VARLGRIERSLLGKSRVATSGGSAHAGMVTNAAALRDSGAELATLAGDDEEGYI